MADAPLRKMIRHIHRLAGAPSAETATDRQLLERFAAGREPDAFAVLVERHGPLVLGVCRRVLRHEQDAEDAFQATFHVLARKAGGVRWHESVANWLYEVARRVAHKARAGSLQRQSRERPTADFPEPASPPETAWHELRQVLDEELDRLPRRYREPLLLCYLEGKTRDEAAQELGWSVGTVKGRLERGREMLRQRLVKRGLSLSAALFGTMLAEGAAAGAVPAALVSTVLDGSFTANALILAKGAMQAMFVARLKLVACVVIALAGTGVAIGQVGTHILASGQRQSLSVAAQPHEPRKVAVRLAAKPLFTMYGSNSKITKSKLLRITTAEEWRALWMEHKTGSPKPNHVAEGLEYAELDFEKVMAIAVFEGEGSNCRGYTSHSISETEGRFLVRLAAHTYQTSGNVLDITQAWGILVIPRSNKEVVLEHDVRTLIGNPPEWKEWARFPALHEKNH